MEQEAKQSEESLDYPANLNTFAPPNDKLLQLGFKVNNPSYDALTLKSELNRKVYPEVFIQHPNLGTLADLCVRALAAGYGAECVPAFAKDPFRLRILHDSIDIESPLDNIYTIEDKEFWKRLVLAKTKDNRLKLQKDPFDWKSLGIALKYAEMVEECPAEFWPEQKMETLANNVKDFIKEFHITKLKPLRDFVFARYLHRDSDTDKSDSTDVSSTTTEEAESGPPSREGEEDEEEQVTEAKGAGGDVELIASAASSETQIGPDIGGGDSLRAELAKWQTLQIEWAAFEAKRAEEKARALEERRAARRARREAQLKRRELREEKLQLRRELQAQPKKKKKPIIVKNVFNLPVEEMENLEDKIIDKRNPERVLQLNKAYEYPPKHCHHVDLRFLRLFDCLEELSIQFHPPLLHDTYHTRYFNFSYNDVEHLAAGICNLEKLRVFRLRNSRMDERKLRMLTAVLKNMNVEEIDFGNNQLHDDCDDAIYDLFQGTTSIKSLQLEGNFFDVNVLRRLSMALRKYEGALEYLGLAGNPLSDEALHALCFVINATAQVQELCLAGIQLSQPSIICCIANDLLRKHKILRKLEIYGMSIDEKAAVEILKALTENKTIQEFDCRGCDLSFEFEFEIAVCLRRNNYIVDNPYLGDESKTEEEIQAYVSRLKNPILIEARADIEKHQKCLEYRPDVAERFSKISIASENVRRHSESIFSWLPHEKRTTIVEEPRCSTFVSEVEPEPFDYNPNQFNLGEFYTHVEVPGSVQRYFYFREKKGRTMCSRED